MADHKERIAHTLDVIDQYELALDNRSVAEIGAGPVLWALATQGCCHLTAFDKDSWFQEIAWSVGIKTFTLDLNLSARLDKEYDCILLCEVLAHIGRWPVLTFQDIFHSLNLGGSLIITSHNLRRLQQRFNLLRGRPLFKAWSVKNDHWQHIREYLPEEAVGMLELAGFSDIQWHYANLHDEHGIRAVLYDLLVKVFPRLSSNYVVVATK